MVLAAVALSAGAPAGSAGQTSATVDAGLSRVEYDGFLPSAAASVASELTVERSALRLLVRGSALLFESGRTSTQGSLDASLLTPYTAAGRLRGEVVASFGGSRYARFASYLHLTAEPRLHYSAPSRTGGAWTGARFGLTSFGDGSLATSALTAGAWFGEWPDVLSLSLRRAQVGDTAYVDFEAVGRFRSGTATIDGLVGARAWSRGGGRGIYGEGSVALPLAARGGTLVVLSGGQYPSDPVNGIVAGRFLSAGMRFRLGSAPPDPSPPAARVRRSDGGAALVTVDVQEARTEAGNGIVIRAVAPGARLVEIAGDFTDWSPVHLIPQADGRWEARFAVVPGVYRLSVRVDGGAWQVPGGVRLVLDELGEPVGLIVVR